jgi:hypothetical protein
MSENSGIQKPRIVKIPCNSCGGGPRNHVVVQTFGTEEHDQERDERPLLFPLSSNAKYGPYAGTT